MNKKCVGCKEKEATKGWLCDSCYDENRKHIIASMLMDARDFEWRGTAIVGIEIMVMVNSVNARSFETWMAKSGLTRISNNSIHTARIMELYNDYAIYRAETKRPALSHTTIGRYLEKTLVRTFEKNDKLVKKTIVRGHFQRSFWSNPFKVDFNND